MKGLLLAEKYYQEFGAEMIAKTVPQLSKRIAAGLVGEGSQCFGFDDEISWDHDFAPGFCLWLTDEDYALYADALKQAYESLPKEFMGFSCSNIIASDRLGVFSINRFYSKFTGLDHAPETNMDWLMISESNLAACTNGKIFSDEMGEFSELRSKLLNFYPDDVLRKKIAARAAVMSQAGQYNLLRTTKRKDTVSASLASARFTEAALSIIFLLNRRYMPFYKWAYKAALQLPLHQLKPCVALLANLPKAVVMMDEGKFSHAYELAFSITEEICENVGKELNVQGFSNSSSNFLQEHLTDIMSGISDPHIACMPPMADFNF